MYTTAQKHRMTPPLNKFINDLANSSLSDVGDREFVNTRPAVNIIEWDDSYDLQLAAPGLAKEEFEIKLQDGVLTLTATADSAVKDFKRKDFDYAGFKRTFKVGELIDAEGITARYDRGILFLNLPKRKKEDLIQKIEIS